MESVLNELKQILEHYNEGLETEAATGFNIIDILASAKSADLIKIVEAALKSEELQ